MPGILINVFLLFYTLSFSSHIQSQPIVEYMPQQYYVNDNMLMKPEKKTDPFLSRSWGAGGMPFNVLYTQPKWRQQFVAISAPTGVWKEAPRVKDTTRLTRQEVPSSTWPKSNSHINSNNNVNQQSRRQYSVLPQLFVSYGWGPIGK